MKASLTIVALLVISCTGSSSRDEFPVSGTPAAAPPAVDASPPIAVNDNGCEAYVRNALPVDTGWLDEQVRLGRCTTQPPAAILDQNNLAASAAAYYGTCNAISASPTQCDLVAGEQYCVAGRWSLLCADTPDCPVGSICVSAVGTGKVPSQLHPSLGRCEVACSPSSNLGQCGRCDLTCDAQRGFCVPVEGSIAFDAGVAP
jgi:hypothetical protein